MQVSQAVSTLLLSFSLPEEAFRARKLGVVGSPFVPEGGVVVMASRHGREVC